MKFVNVTELEIKMRKLPYLPLIAFLFTLTLVSTPRQKPVSAIETAFERFWSAKAPREAEQAVPDILKSGATFDDAIKRLKKGRAYAAQRSGITMMSTKSKFGIEHFFAVNVPENYDPAKAYQVRFQLHGGVNRTDSNQPRGSGAIGQLAGAPDQIYVLPFAWASASWWTDDQVRNFGAMVDALKRVYNVDENRVAVSGVSDGGTGAYYIAMHETTPFASFLPLNGFIMVLANPDIDDGALFPNNLRNKPFFVVNGGKDPLYPAAIVEPYTRHLMKAGVTVDYHPQPDGEHNTRWWPEVKDAFERFVKDHPREPHPVKLTWESLDLTDNRAHWLTIDQYGKKADSKSVVMRDANLFEDDDPLSVVTRASAPMFDRTEATGRVDLTREGNTVYATTRGVTEFTLLLSPDVFDFSKPIVVAVNGQPVFNGRVERKLETLLKWAARDNDRTMLYGAELKIKL